MSTRYVTRPIIVDGEYELALDLLRCHRNAPSVRGSGNGLVEKCGDDEDDVRPADEYFVRNADDNDPDGFLIRRISDELACLLEQPRDRE